MRKTAMQINYEAMKKWNEQRATNEKKALERFWKLMSDPILHPPKCDKFELIDKIKTLLK